MDWRVSCFLQDPSTDLPAVKQTNKKTRNHHKLFNVVLSHTHTLHNQRQFIVFSLFYQAILELCWNHGIFSLLHYLHITLKRKNILTMRTLSNNQTWIMRAKKWFACPFVSGETNWWQSDMSTVRRSSHQHKGTTQVLLNILSVHLS